MTYFLPQLVRLLMTHRAIYLTKSDQAYSLTIAMMVWGPSRSRMIYANLLSWNAHWPRNLSALTTSDSSSLLSMMMALSKNSVLMT